MAQKHVRSGDSVSVAPLGDQLATSSTVAIIKSEQLEVLRLVLPAGKVLREHRAPGEITVLCVEGSVEFTTPEKTITLHPNDFLHLEAKVLHALVAVTDSSLLVTICRPFRNTSDQ